MIASRPFIIGTPASLVPDVAPNIRRPNTWLRENSKWRTEWLWQVLAARSPSRVWFLAIENPEAVANSRLVADQLVSGTRYSCPNSPPRPSAGGERPSLYEQISILPRSFADPCTGHRFRSRHTSSFRKVVHLPNHDQRGHQGFLYSRYFVMLSPCSLGHPTA